VWILNVNFLLQNLKDMQAYAQSLRRARSNLVTTNTIAGLPAQSGGEEPGCGTGKTGSKGKPVNAGIRLPTLSPI